MQRCEVSAEHHFTTFLSILPDARECCGGYILLKTYLCESFVHHLSGLFNDLWKCTGEVRGQKGVMGRRKKQEGMVQHNNRVMKNISTGGRATCAVDHRTLLPPSLVLQTLRSNQVHKCTVFWHLLQFTLHPTEMCWLVAQNSLCGDFGLSLPGQVLGLLV